MRAIVADNDVGGQFEIVMLILHSDEWREIWESLGRIVETFENLGLDRNAPDTEVWQVCQSRQVVLVTGNRNAADDESLEVAMRTWNREDSLPVITFADPLRVIKEGGYAERAAIRLLDYLLVIDQYRGAGRLFIP